MNEITATLHFDGWLEVGMGFVINTSFSCALQLAKRLPILSFLITLQHRSDMWEIPY